MKKSGSKRSVLSVILRESSGPEKQDGLGGEVAIEGAVYAFH